MNPGVALPAYLVDRYGRVKTNEVFYGLAAVTIVVMGEQFVCCVFVACVRMC